MTQLQSNARFCAITSKFQHAISPTHEQFHEFAKRGNLVPLIVDLVADVETPVSAFAKIDNGNPCFLFESAERNEESGRFSFIGFDPLKLFNSAECKGDPLTQLQKILSLHSAIQLPIRESLHLDAEIGRTQARLGYSSGQE